MTSAPFQRAFSSAPCQGLKGRLRQKPSRAAEPLTQRRVNESGRPAGPNKNWLRARVPGADFSSAWGLMLEKSTTSFRTSSPFAAPVSIFIFLQTFTKSASTTVASNARRTAAMRSGGGLNGRTPFS